VDRDPFLLSASRWLSANIKFKCDCMISDTGADDLIILAFCGIIVIILWFFDWMTGRASDL